ncbi:MAG: adenine deaminase [bacterium]|nr:adenine deaminase [bacterium]
MSNFSISGQIVDIFKREIFPGRIEICQGRITAIQKMEKVEETHYILPGFIDAHVHVESSMLVPTEFARMATIHGTIGSVSDPHEIANVCGMAGVEFMLENASKSPFKFAFGAPSCVPATVFETAGAELDATDVTTLLERDDIYYLSEVMNFPGVLLRSPDILEKIASARRLGKPIDGHAPGLRGNDVISYCAAGVTTDHECFTIEEAREKLSSGMKILIREGSAAKNFDELIPLLGENPESIMFCSDDKHPDDLLQGHINQLVSRALDKGFELFDVLRAATLNPAVHYNLPIGMLRVGDDADFIVTDDLKTMRITRTYIAGTLCSKDGQPLLSSVISTAINNFSCPIISRSDIALVAHGKTLNAIGVIDGQIVTTALTAKANIKDGLAISDPDNDLIKIVVINRYQSAKPAVAFVSGTGLKHGAIASTVAHDSHNIVAIGSDDQDIVAAINTLIDLRGGLAVANKDNIVALPLPVAGLMSLESGEFVSAQYRQLDEIAHSLGTTLHAPFMTLSFLALPVIPELKLTDLGLFNVNIFNFTELFI